MTFAGVLACGPAPVDSPSEVAAAPPELAFTGCAAVRSGPVCLVPAAGAALTLWVDVTGARELDVAIDGEPVQVRRRDVEGGQQLQVAVPGGAGELTLVERGAGGRAALRLGAAARPGDVRDAWLRLRAGDGVGAATRVLPIVVVGLAQLRKRCLATGHHELALAIAGLTRAVAGRAGMVSEVSESTQAGAFILTQIKPRDLAAAAVWLASEAGALQEFPTGRARAPYYAGLVAHATGDMRGALREFAEGERLARRLGLTRDQLSASAMHTVLLAEIGDDAVVQARVRDAAARAGELAECPRATLLNNLGWAQLRLLEAGLLVDDPVPLLVEALALHEGPCSDPERLDNVRTNLALAALVRGDPEEARPLLDLLHERPRGGADASWQRELETRAALLEGRLGDLDDPVLEADPVELTDLALRWADALRRARVRAAWGLDEAAISALRAAEAVLDEQVHALGIAEGREQFMAGKRRSGELLVDLLVAAGRPGEALCAARLARVRALRAVDRAARLAGLEPDVRARWDAGVFAYQRLRAQEEQLRQDRWQFVGPALDRHLAREREVHTQMRRALDDAYALLGRASDAPTCADLTGPAAGELILLVQPVPDGLVAFAADAEGVAVSRLAALDPADPAALARALLGPFTAALRRARSLRVLSTSALAEVAVHALPWADDIVLAAMPVVYGLDLPGPRPAAAWQGGAALVVADPTGNLAHARSEAATVERALRAQGWRVQAPASTGGAELRAGAAGVDLLHYAGHGRRAGLSGWDSALVLADDTSLGVDDILALARAPAVVVLSGCETGTSDAHALAGGMNLGRAFLLAGASGVIAASGVLDDAIAAEVSAELYSAFAPDEQLDAPAALRRAVLAVRARHPGDSAWAQLHALAP